MEEAPRATKEHGLSRLRSIGRSMLVGMGSVLDIGGGRRNPLKREIETDSFDADAKALESDGKWLFRDKE